ncbi:MAG: flagellar basal body P-ring formation chaperone FlgA [Desulfovibrio sp.]|nr:flagellar basal body P-ring formation chaperone FlgA [Desulfovibrio sp.]
MFRVKICQKPALCRPLLFLPLFLLLLLGPSWAQDLVAPRVIAPGNQPAAQGGAMVRDRQELFLSPAAQDVRARHTQSRLAQGQAPLPDQQGSPALSLESSWRIKIHNAAICQGNTVLLGEIAQPLGTLPNWESLKTRELWPAPPEEGKPLQINRSNLAQALNERLGRDLASHCILPTSLVIQKGGLLVRENDLRAYVVKSLTPMLRAMPGEVEFTDFHLPEYIFLAHAGQQVQLEQPKMNAGRVGLRFAVLEADGKILRRVSGSITLTQWVTVPTAARNLSKGEALTPEAVTFSRINARRLKETAWDGKGGPWQMMRSLSAGEPILQSDLATQMMIRRGEIVTLIYARGNLRLETQAEALADGEPGATISVRNLQTKKQIFATVKDNRTVIIH